MKYFNPHTPYLILILSGPFGWYTDVITETFFPSFAEPTVLFGGFALMVLCDALYRFRSAALPISLWCYHKYINMVR